MNLAHLVSRRPAAPAAATVGLLVPLAVIDRRLQATGGPGIIPFELAGSAGSDAILKRWGEAARSWAVASLVLDFPSLAAYTTLNLVLVERLRQRAIARGDHFLALLARPVAAVQIVAGANDAIENASLLLVVARRGDPDRAALARVLISDISITLVAGASLSLGHETSSLNTHARRVGRDRCRTAIRRARPRR